MIKSLKKRKEFFKFLNFFYLKTKHNKFLQFNFQSFIIICSGHFLNLKHNQNYKYLVKISKFSYFKILFAYLPLKKIIYFSNAGLNNKLFFFRLLMRGYLLIDFELLNLNINKKKILFSKDERQFLQKYFKNKKILKKLLNQKYLNFNFKNNLNNIHCIITGTITPKSSFILNKFKNKNVKKILVHHGLNSGFIDEPRQGYSNNSHVDHVIYFGNLMKKTSQKKNNLILKRYATKNIQSHYCSNGLQYRKFKIQTSKNLDENRFLFVGTEFNNKNFYLPYARILESEHYELAKLYKSLFKDIKYAPHPDCLNKKMINLFNKGIEYKWENNMLNYDFLIFNHWSTAIVKAMFSNKPIIFVDHKIRKFSNEGLKFIKQRTIYIDGQKLNRRTLLNKIRNYKKRDFSNLLEKYFPKNLNNIETEVLKII